MEPTSVAAESPSVSIQAGSIKLEIKHVISIVTAVFFVAGFYFTQKFELSTIKDKQGDAIAAEKTYRDAISVRLQAVEQRMATTDLLLQELKERMDREEARKNKRD